MPWCGSICLGMGIKVSGELHWWDWGCLCQGCFLVVRAREMRKKAHKTVMG